MDRDSELALVARLRTGDHAAFDEVYDSFNARLFGFLARLSRRRDVAEDLLEETWLRLVAKAGTLHPDTRIGPWLFTVARNLHISYCRSRLLESSSVADLIGLWPFGVAVPSPFENASANEIERRIESALASLPAASREVLLLVGVEGFEPVDAASICGVTPEALRQRLHRARTLLARELKRASEPHLTTMSEVMT